MKSPAKSTVVQQGVGVLGLIGILLILTYVLFVGIGLIEANVNDRFGDLSWQQTFLTDLAQRGITPLLGLSFILVSNILAYGFSPEPNQGSLVKDGRFWMFVVSSLLGLFYLIMIFLYFNTTGQLLSNASTQREQGLTQIEQIVQGRLGEFKTIKDSGEIDKLLANEQLPAPQKEVLTRYKEDPAGVEKQMNEEAGKERAKLEGEFKEFKTTLTLARSQTGLRSAILALSYSVLGWVGLRNVLRG